MKSFKSQYCRGLAACAADPGHFVVKDFLEKPFCLRSPMACDDSGSTLDAIWGHHSDPQIAACRRGARKAHVFLLFLSFCFLFCFFCGPPRHATIRGPLWMPSGATRRTLRSQRAIGERENNHFQRCFFCVFFCVFCFWFVLLGLGVYFGCHLGPPFGP